MALGGYNRIVRISILVLFKCNVIMFCGIYITIITILYLIMILSAKNLLYNAMMHPRTRSNASLLTSLITSRGDNVDLMYIMCITLK